MKKLAIVGLVGLSLQAAYLEVEPKLAEQSVAFEVGRVSGCEVFTEEVEVLQSERVKVRL